MWYRLYLLVSLIGAGSAHAQAGGPDQPTGSTVGITRAVIVDALDRFAGPETTVLLSPLVLDVDLGDAKARGLERGPRGFSGRRDAAVLQAMTQRLPRPIAICEGNCERPADWLTLVLSDPVVAGDSAKIFVSWEHKVPGDDWVRGGTSIYYLARSDHVWTVTEVERVSIN